MQREALGCSGIRGTSVRDSQGTRKCVFGRRTRCRAGGDLRDEQDHPRAALEHGVVPRDQPHAVVPGPVGGHKGDGDEEEHPEQRRGRVAQGEEAQAPAAHGRVPEVGADALVVHDAGLHRLVPEIGLGDAEGVEEHDEGQQLHCHARQHNEQRGPRRRPGDPRRRRGGREGRALGLRARGDARVRLHRRARGRRGGVRGGRQRKGGTGRCGTRGRDGGAAAKCGRWRRPRGTAVGGTP